MPSRKHVGRGGIFGWYRLVIHFQGYRATKAASMMLQIMVPWVGKRIKLCCCKSSGAVER